MEHWENFLLTECTGAQLLPNGIVHPIALFHVPITGAGTSIAEMFSLGQAESDLISPRGTTPEFDQKKSREAGHPWSGLAGLDCMA